MIGMTRRHVTPIGDIVKSVFETIESGKTLTREDVDKEWRSLAGADAARNAVCRYSA